MKNKAESNLVNICLFVVLCLIGGTTYAFQKLGVENGLPFWSAGLRFLIAGTIMLIYALITRKFKVDAHTITTAILYGCLYFCLPFGAIYWVGQYLPSGMLSVLSASVTIFSIGFNYLFKAEKITVYQIIGILISMIGIGLIFLQSIVFTTNKLTIFCLIISLFAYLSAAFSTVFLKVKVFKIYTLSFNAMSLLIGGVILNFVSLLIENGDRWYSDYSLFSLIYLALMGSMCATAIMTHLLKNWNVAKVTAYRFIVPVISLVVGFVFFSEKLAMNELCGAFLIIIGMVFINIIKTKNSNIKDKSLIQVFEEFDQK